MSVQVVESALSDVQGHPNKPLALGIAEGLTIAFFTSQKIDAEQFKELCRRIRVMGEQIKQVRQ